MNFDVIVNGALGVYLATTLILGFELIFDFLHIRPAKITVPMRLVGIGMLSDAAAIILGGFLPQLCPISDAVLALTVFIDLLTSYFLTLTGFSLLEGGWPKLRTVVILALVMLAPWCLVWFSGNGSLILSILSNLVSVVIVAIITVRIWRHDRKLNLHYSNLESHKYRWYIVFSVWVLLLTPIYNVSNMLDLFEGYLQVACYLAMCGMYLYLARNVYFADMVQQAHLLEVASEDNVSFGMEDKDMQQMSAEGIFSQQDLEEMERKMHSLMLEQKVYRDPDLCVDRLARMMNTNSSYFYYFMRDQLQSNFFDLVNKYRIEEAKRMLLNGDKVDVIATECGYNSANSFRRVFKKMTGEAPTQWRDSQTV